MSTLSPYSRTRSATLVSSSHVTPRHPLKFLHAFAASLIPHLSSYIHPVANVQDDSDSPTRFADAIHRLARVVSTRRFILRRLVPRPLTRRRARVWTPWENSRAHPRAVPLFSSSSSSRRRARETPPPPIRTRRRSTGPARASPTMGARAAPTGAAWPPRASPPRRSSPSRRAPYSPHPLAVFAFSTASFAGLKSSRSHRPHAKARLRLASCVGVAPTTRWTR